jgi:cell division protein FtsI/penicillin-binding protein 2
MKMIVNILVLITLLTSITYANQKIITDDNVTVAYSQKVYKLTFFGTAYDKKRVRELLQKINKQVPINIVSAMRRYFRDTHQEYRILLYGVSKKDMVKIQEILDDTLMKGFSFVLSGEQRVYPYGEFLTPLFGQIRKKIDATTNYTYIEGVNGLEKVCSSKKEDTHLNIDFKMQRSLEKEVYELKALFDAKEMTSVILDTDTFFVKAFASSNRYNPKHIQRKDFAKLNINAVQYLFKLNEFAILVEDMLYLNAKNPKYQIYADLELTKPSGIDLPYERVYDNTNIEGFKNYKVNFMQLVKAYAPFYTDGYIGKPQVVKNQPSDKKHLISKELAKSLKKQADLFFGNMPGRVVTLEFQDKNVSATIYMKCFIENEHHYMKAYFTIYSEEK